MEFYRRAIEAYGALPFVTKVCLFVGIFVVTTAGGIAAIVLLPADHFVRPPGPDSWWRRHRAVRISGLVLKNALGLVILPLGIVMILPLVPGPGLVFILLALSLLDFPGKRRLERKLLGRPSVLKYLNDLRGHFGRPPLDVSER